MTNCPSCKKSSQHLFLAKDRNRKVSNQAFDYFQCASCGLLFLPEPPKNLDEFYGEEYYAEPSYEKIKKVAGAEGYQLDMVTRFVKAGTLLEVGPGFGVFAYAAKKAGFAVDVIEKEERCCNFLTRVIGVKAVQSERPQEAIKAMPKHDVIALWHVIEHLPMPLDFLKSAVENLSPGGILLMATPNPEAFQFRLMKANWPHIDAPRHLYLFPEAALNNFLEPLGLKRVFCTFNDKGARSWNRFGWQRYFMNKFSNKGMQRLSFVLGYFFSILFMVFDTRGRFGCAYTVVFRKGHQPTP